MVLAVSVNDVSVAYNSLESWQKSIMLILFWGAIHSTFPLQFFACITAFLHFGASLDLNGNRLSPTPLRRDVTNFAPGVMILKNKANLLLLH